MSTSPRANDRTLPEAQHDRPDPRGGARGQPQPRLAEQAEQRGGQQQRPVVVDPVGQGRREQAGNQLGGRERRQQVAGVCRVPAAGEVAGCEPGQRGVELDGLHGR